MMGELHFRNMSQEEKFVDLTDRMTKFHQLELPGQPRAMHMGTSYLVVDMWSYIKELRDEIEKLHRK